jgi:hypothetical protein
VIGGRPATIVRLTVGIGREPRLAALATLAIPVAFDGKPDNTGRIDGDERLHTRGGDRFPGLIKMTEIVSADVLGDPLPGIGLGSTFAFVAPRMHVGGLEQEPVSNPAIGTTS